MKPTSFLKRNGKKELYIFFILFYFILIFFRLYIDMYIF